MERLTIGKVEHFKMGTSYLTLWEPIPGVLYNYMEGAFEVPFLEPIVAYSQRVIDHGEAVFFHDWARMTRYESDTRSRLTKWVLARRQRIERSHILAQSKLLSMAISVASLVLGD